MQPRRKHLKIFFLFVLLWPIILWCFIAAFESRSCKQVAPSKIECTGDCTAQIEITTNEQLIFENASKNPFPDEKGKRRGKIFAGDETREFWESCPTAGLGLNSTFIACFIDGRLGNVVWNYLSLWATAKRYKLRPLFEQSSLDFLQTYFKKSPMTIPSVEGLDKKCSMNGQLIRDYTMNESLIDYPRDLFQKLESPPKHGFEILRYYFYAVTSEYLVPYWADLKTDLVLKDEFTEEAQRILTGIRDHRIQGLTKMTGKKFELLKNKFEFVGVHVRRTDYMSHLEMVHPGSSAAGSKFYLAAMTWMESKVNRPLIFVVVSDDPVWARRRIVRRRQDAYLEGNSDVSNPGLDLAILAACNHTIFAYGTFGLTGALLSSSPESLVVVYDPLNGTVTKEMEFAANLPGWRIMDSDGNFNYENRGINFSYYLHPGFNKTII